MNKEEYDKLLNLIDKCIAELDRELYKLNHPGIFTRIGMWLFVKLGLDNPKINIYHKDYKKD